MNYDIRHIILPVMAALACAIASCTSDSDSDAIVATSPEEMRFEVAGTTYAGATRTVATTNENVIDQPFMIFGDVNLGGTDLKTILDWVSVEYEKDNKIWNYLGDARQYWYMGQEHSFVAIHPYIAEEDEQVEILTYEGNKLSFTYCLPEKMEDAKDLLFATHRRKYSLDNAGPVKFKFTHLLARINISLGLIEKELMYDHVDEATDNTGNVVGKKNEYIKVHAVEFHGIKTKASFGFTPKVLTNGATSTYDYDKSYLPRDDDERRDVVVTLNEACKVPNSYKEGEVEGAEDQIKYVTALKEEEVIVMLPQKLGSDPEADSEPIMVVNYSINEDADLKRKIIIPLKGTEWKEGVSYTYKFLIDNVYKGHIIDEGIIIVDIDDFRLHDEEEVGDDSWITDKDDPGHNINYGYEEGEGGSCGPTN